MIRSGRVSEEWRTYRRLLGYVRPYAWRLGAGFLFGILFALANGGLVWVVKGGFDEVFGRGAGRQPGPMLIVAVFFPLVGLLRGAADYFSAYYIRWVGHRVVMDLRNALFSHMQGLSIGYFSRSRTGELISRTTNDTLLVERAVSTVVADLAKQPVTLVSMVVWIFLVDVRLAAVSLVVFPVCLIPIAVFGRRIRRNARRAQEHIADVVSILQETVTGIRIVKAFGMEAYEIRRFVENTGAFFRRIMRVARANVIVEPIIVFIATVGVSLVLVYVRAAGMTVGEFAGFATALMLMYEPVKKLSRIHLSVQQSSGAADRIFEVLDTESAVRERPGARPLRGEVREISFEQVTFGYDDAPVLRDVAFRVGAGERVAIVGSSGAGKTSLVNLIPRFYDVSGGAVRINGEDVRDLTLESLRRRIGLVTQETFLFNDTVARNIAYGSPEADRAAVEDAARRAHADGFIRAMPEGYDTVVGERGVRLSGGQRQRLAIARAITRNPPILILDEATSALDTESERLVQAALDEVMKGRTVFAIAHRLSTIANCDRIFVLDGGRVVESGSHESLLAAGGVYRRLYDMQFGTAGPGGAG
ncbi:MAG: ABC transporter ATP-binding protein [Lentisphaerae bacterium]|nr:ABC transporter ATP-binding protein [Lentisphaerota bacterium]